MTGKVKTQILHDFVNKNMEQVIRYTMAFRELLIRNLNDGIFYDEPEYLVAKTGVMGLETVCALEDMFDSPQKLEFQALLDIVTKKGNEETQREAIDILEQICHKLMYFQNKILLIDEKEIDDFSENEDVEKERDKKFAEFGGAKAFFDRFLDENHQNAA